MLYMKFIPCIYHIHTYIKIQSIKKHTKHIYIFMVYDIIYHKYAKYVLHKNNLFTHSKIFHV